MKIKKIIETDTAHRLLGDKCDVGKCGHLHGHRYKFEVELESDSISKIGYIANFTDIKKIITDKFDHRLILNSEDDELIRFLKSQKMDFTVVIGNPTAENLANVVVDDILLVYHEEYVKFKSIHVRVWETPSCYAETRYTS